MKDESTLLLLHEAVREIKPADLRSNRWLAEYHRRQENKDTRLAWIASLERGDGDSQEVVHAYAVLAVDRRYEHRWDWRWRSTSWDASGSPGGMLQHRQPGAPQEGVRSGHRRRQGRAARPREPEIFQADLHEAQERRDLAMRKNEAAREPLPYLAEHPFSRTVLPAAPAGEPRGRGGHPPPGQALPGDGDRQKAVEQWRKAAKMHLEDKNYGLCRLVLDEQRIAADPGHAEAAAALAQLKVRLGSTAAAARRLPSRRHRRRRRVRAEAEPAPEEKAAKGKEAAKGKGTEGSRQLSRRGAGRQPAPDLRSPAVRARKPLVSRDHRRAQRT